MGFLNAYNIITHYHFAFFCIYLFGSQVYIATNNTDISTKRDIRDIELCTHFGADLFFSS